MITKRTVLILGAGASAPYGFPIGRGLKDKILAGLASKGDIGFYLSAGFTHESMAEFVDVLSTSPYPTIDEILSFRPSLARIGKFSIVKALSTAQVKDKIFPPRDWYELLFNRLELENEDAPQPPLAILTFNYDNSLEYFFTHIIDRLFEGGHQKFVKAKFSTIPIIHLHGRLGPYPVNDDPMQMLEVSLKTSDIRVVSDNDLDKSAEFQEATSLLAQAERVVFLGFGYAETNIRRLKLSAWRDDVEIFGTCFLMDQKAIYPIFHDRIALCGNGTQCKQALQEWQNIL